MELFNQYYNSDVQFLLDLFSLQQPFPEEKALALARANHVYAEYGNHKNTLKKWIDCGLLEKTADGCIQISKQRELRRFASPPNYLEQNCLANLCGTKEAELFLPQGTRAKFSQTGQSNLDYIWRQNTVGKMSETGFVDPAVFQVILRAIYEKRMIEETYCTNDDPTVHTAVSVPYRLEYNVYDGRWWLISYHWEQNRAIKSSLYNIKAAQLGERHRISEQTIQKAIMKNVVEEPVKLRVTNIKNGLERCFLTFENMLDISAYQIDREKGEYELQFCFFRWDENIIIRKLLYLGECVTVISPDSIRQGLLLELQNCLRMQSRS